MHSSHEEADTRMILHAIFGVQQFKEQKVKGRIIIKCSDTDVLVLFVHVFPNLESTEQMWFLTRTITNAKNNRRYIRKETEVVVLRYRKTTIFWSAKKPLVHADEGMVHLVVVEPDLYLYTLQAFT
jgi:hypothetical protein